MTRFFLFAFIFLFACSETQELKIDYDQENISARYVFDAAEKLLKKKRYSAVDTAYLWIKKHNLVFYADSVLLKHIELYGFQERFEKQISEYSKIFSSDTLDNHTRVPHFYNQIGMSYFKLSKVLVESAIDSTMIKSAISFFKKSYSYKLFYDPFISASSLYYGGLSHLKIGEKEKAHSLFSQLVEDSIITDFQIKAYFKRNNLDNPEDITISDSMRTAYADFFTARNLRRKAISDSLENLEDNISPDSLQKRAREITEGTVNEGMPENFMNLGEDQKEENLSKELKKDTENKVPLNEEKISEQAEKEKILKKKKNSGNDVLILENEEE
jgi:hypothetical protein